MGRKESNLPEKILLLLAKNVEFEQRKMTKELKVSYPTLLTHLKPLKEQGLVKISRYEPSDCNGKDRNIYALTASGFTRALMMCFNVPKSIIAKKDIETIIRKHSEKMLTFKKWNLFVENDLMNFVLTNIEHGSKPDFLLPFIHANNLECPLEKQLEKLSPTYSGPEQLTPLDGAILTYPLLTGTICHSGKNYIEVIKQDRELSDFINQQLSKLEKYEQQELAKIISVKKWLVP